VRGQNAEGRDSTKNWVCAELGNGKMNLRSHPTAPRKGYMRVNLSAPNSETSPGLSVEDQRVLNLAGFSRFCCG